MNYAALLPVLAAASFALPLVVRALEAFGVGRGPSVALVLLAASVVVAVWAVNARLALLRAGVERGPAAARADGGVLAPGGASVGAAEGVALRRREAQEESHASL